jgi:hypothetical protein
MALTLAELLALLPDNSTGAIDADDLRTVVTELFTPAHSATSRFAFDYQTAAAPATGRCTMTGGWTTTATELVLSETTMDGWVTPFALFARSLPLAFILGGVNTELRGTITGPAVDAGAYRRAPVTVTKATGTAANLAVMTLTVTVPVAP